MRLLRSLLIAGLLLSLASCLGSREERVERLVTLGDSYHEKGQLEEASIIYRKALQLDRRNAKAWYHLGINSISQGNGTSASQAFTRAVELDPDNLEAFRKLAEMHLYALASPLPVQPDEIFANLVRITEAAERTHPDAFEVLYIKAGILQHQKAADQAMAMMRRAWEKRPDDMGATLSLGAMLVARNQFDEAEKIVTPLTEKDETAPAAYNFLYSLMARTNRLDEAEQLLRAKCERFPNDASNWIMGF